MRPSFAIISNPWKQRSSDWKYPTKREKTGLRMLQLLWPIYTATTKLPVIGNFQPVFFRGLEKPRTVLNS